MICEFDDDGRPFITCDNLTAEGSEKKTFATDLVYCTKDKANLIGDKTVDGKHKPVLDLDFDCKLVPSSTNGHFHLYVNKEVDHKKWETMLIAMRDAGILQQGFVDGAIRCGQATVRPEWIKKKG